jgi:integration host factor subunit alpha
MTITKARIVDTISEQTGFPKNKSSEMVEILMELVKKSLESGWNRYRRSICLSM